MYQVELERLKLRQLEEDKQRLQQQVGELCFEKCSPGSAGTHGSDCCAHCPEGLTKVGLVFKLKPRTMLV